MRTVDEIILANRAQMQNDRNRKQDKSYFREMLLKQIEEKGYFTAGLKQGELLETPFFLLVHPLPSEDDNIMFHNHNCFELAYVYRGGCHNRRQEYEVMLHQGELLLMNPQAIHCLYTDSAEDVIFNFLIPENTVNQTHTNVWPDNPITAFFFDYLHHIRTGPDFLVINSDPNDGMDALIQHLIIEYYEKQIGYNAMLQTGLMQLFVYMARRYSQSMRSLPLQYTSPVVRQAMLFIAENTATVTLQDLAKKFSYHEKHISRQMKKELGLSFTQFLQLQRLRKAAQLLAHTNMSVEQVAKEVGYHNLSHFYDLFQHLYNMTPAVWRTNNNR